MVAVAPDDRRKCEWCGGEVADDTGASYLTSPEDPGEDFCFCICCKCKTKLAKELGAELR